MLFYTRIPWIFFEQAQSLQLANITIHKIRKKLQ